MKTPKKFKNFKSHNKDFIAQFTSSSEMQREINKYLTDKYFLHKKSTRLTGYNLNDSDKLKEFMWHYGKIYTFLYLHPKYKLTLDYFDTYPFVIPLKCVWESKTKNILITGVNLNLVPPKFKTWILEQMFFRLRTAYLRTMLDRRKHENILIWKQTISNNWIDFFKLLNNKLKVTGYESAIRSYIIKTGEGKKENETKLIYRVSLLDWVYIANFDTKNIISKKGITLNKIYMDYIKKMNLMKRKV